MIIVVLCLVGIALCLYGMHIEKRVQVNPNYKAACDLSDKVSCTRTFRSQYGALLGVSNIYVALAFYTVLLILALLHLHALVFIGALAAVVVSLYLGYLQYGKLRVVCLLCTALYVVNLLLLLLARH